MLVPACPPKGRHSPPRLSSKTFNWRNQQKILQTWVPSHVMVSLTHPHRCTHTNMHSYTNTCTPTRAHMQTHLHVLEHTEACMHMCVQYTNALARMDTCMHVCVRTPVGTPLSLQRKLRLPIHRPSPCQGCSPLLRGRSCGDRPACGPGDKPGSLSPPRCLRPLSPALRKAHLAGEGTPPPALGLCFETILAPSRATRQRGPSPDLRWGQRASGPGLQALEKTGGAVHVKHTG